MTQGQARAPARLVLATGNPGKALEFAELFAGLPLRLVPQSEFQVPEADEPAATFLENALAKARHAARHTGLAALADDSGLCVRRLGGAPGVRSARFASSELAGGSREAQDAANNARLLQCLDAVDDPVDRSAHFVCVLVAVREPDDPEPLIAHGWLHGCIATGLVGKAGFGYDPLFMLPDGMTLAQLATEAKNVISHRARAARQMAQLLQAFWGIGAFPAVSP